MLSRFEEGRLGTCEINICTLLQIMYFPDTDPPTVLMLFIFSHGGENGEISTEQGDSFSTYDVWDALSCNQLLRDCLKINVFGVRVIYKNEL